MLDNEARQDIETIKQEADKMWGSDCEFCGLEIMRSPYPEFELTFRLYQKIDVGIYYDRSALDIGIRQEGRYVLLGKFTDKQVLRGMKAIQSENLRHNLQVLDEVAREMAAKR